MVENNIKTSSFEFDHLNMFEPLLKAAPSFQKKWDAFHEKYSSEGELPLYLVLGDLADHLIHDLELGNTRRFDAIFGVVERWHIGGDPYVKEAATVGLLEDLQNGHLHRRTRPEDFLPWLQPQTLKWWAKVHEFWTEDKINSLTVRSAAQQAISARSARQARKPA
jgi:hypothetical protein